MKRLICCFDGTWNDDKSEETLTNVVKLFRAIPLKDAAGIEQLKHYVVGIATRQMTGRLRFALGASGVEVSDRIRAGFRFLVANYEPGDEIYLFGFSRGAFQARSLAGLISYLGIPRLDSGVTPEEAWSVYRWRHKPWMRGRPLERVRNASHYPAAISCLGLWDTVGNLGNPLFTRARVSRSVKFHDTTLSDNVGVALQALSIDEKRGPFSPTFWTIPKGQSLPPGQIVEQVWFAGSHADVGGGYRESGLSDIGLLWMAERVTANTPLAIDLERLARTTRPDPLAVQHSSTVGAIFKWSALCPFVRLIRQDIHGISWGRRLLLGSWRTSKVAHGEVPINEQIHESVLERFGKAVDERALEDQRLIVYRPRNLAAALGKPWT